VGVAPRFGLQGVWADGPNALVLLQTTFGDDDAQILVSLRVFGPLRAGLDGLAELQAITLLDSTGNTPLRRGVQRLRLGFAFPGDGATFAAGLGLNLVEVMDTITASIGPFFRAAM
jgi:hypothetical protein